MTLILTYVTPKEHANLAVLETGMRNAGFDQRRYNLIENRYEGTIEETQINNLLVCEGVESVKGIREVSSY